MSGLMSRPSVLVGGLAVASISGVCLYLLLRREEEWQASRQGGLSSRSGTVGNSGGSFFLKFHLKQSLLLPDVNIN